MKKILFVTLSNIGDVILTLPVLDTFINLYPEAEITVLCGAKPKEIFEDNPAIFRLIVYDKYSPLLSKIRLFNELNSQRFDLVIDLKNTMFGACLRAKYRTSPFVRIPRNIRHVRDRHLFKVRHIVNTRVNIHRRSFNIRDNDRAGIARLLREAGIRETDRILVIAPGARSSTKRWDARNFREVVERLTSDIFSRIVLVGDRGDLPICEVVSSGKKDVLNLCGRTTLRELAALLDKSSLLLTNDSAVMHLASYLNRPVLAIFGPTDERKYGPWSDKSVVLRKHLFCSPCEKAQCRFGTLECLQSVRVEEVLRSIRDTLSNRRAVSHTPGKSGFNRILIVRTDRIGDVVLSTPVIKALRDHYPSSYIAIMVTPQTSELLQGNPYLDEVIILDKKDKHRGIRGMLKLIRQIRMRRFELAVILHSTNRVNLITYLAGIPTRIGYARKMGFLLTRKFPYVKMQGIKHELEYNLDVLKLIGIESKERELFVPLHREAEERIKNLLREKKISEQDKLILLHPAASCISKVWPKERFAELANRFIEELGVQIAVISDKKDKPIADWIVSCIRHPVVNFAGMLSLSETASLLKRASLFISNDSGPVHISSAVGTPVLSIFGRKQPGLGPVRWGPVGKKDRFIQKDVGCIQCLAHNCVKKFACLKAITVDDVFEVAKGMLR